MKKIGILVFIILLANGAFAQLEISAFSATGGAFSTSWVTGYQSLGINPGNLGWDRDNHAASIGLLEFSGSIYSEVLDRKKVYNDLFNENISLSYSEKVEAAKSFTNKKLWAQAAITWLGFSFNDEKIGGLAFSVRDRGMWSTKLNGKAADFIFNGYHDSYFDSLAVENGDTIGYCTDPQMASAVYNGTEGYFAWYREYNLGYGRKVLDISDIKLYAGIGLKYIVGYGSFQYVQTSTGVDAYSALSPVFEVDFNQPTPSAVSGNGLKKVGTGFGIDLGATLMFKERLKVSLALNDIGSINWDGNVYEGNNTSVWKIETAGLDNYNIFSQGQLIVSDNAPNDPNIWEGVDSRKTNLPMNLRLGGSYIILPGLEAGADIYLPLETKSPGSMQKSVFAFGGRFEPIRWIRLSMGFVAGGDYGLNLPLGISFFPVRSASSSWEMGIAVRDFSTLMKDSKPTISAAFGFLSFKFGKG